MKKILKLLEKNFWFLLVLLLLTTYFFYTKNEGFKSNNKPKVKKGIPSKAKDKHKK